MFSPAQQWAIPLVALFLVLPHNGWKQCNSCPILKAGVLFAQRHFTDLHALHRIIYLRFRWFVLLWATRNVVLYRFHHKVLRKGIYLIYHGSRKFQPWSCCQITDEVICCKECIRAEDHRSTRKGLNRVLIWFEDQKLLVLRRLILAKRLDLQLWIAYKSLRTFQAFENKCSDGYY